MAAPFLSVHIIPGYVDGFVFTWELTRNFIDPAPWTFYVEQGPAVDGPWTVLSPGLVGVAIWADNLKRVFNKNRVLFFRLRLVTTEATYYSEVITPYGDLPRRDYLIVKDIMRREILQQQKLSGVRAMLWCKSTWGTKCTACVDPFTGDIMTSNCADCMGQGIVPPYHGPYEIWVTFSTDQKNTEQSAEGAGLKQDYNWTVRMIGFPYVHDNDIILDIASDKRYIVDGVANELEIRRVPVIQMIGVHELPVSDPAYKLNTSQEQEGCVFP